MDKCHKEERMFGEYIIIFGYVQGMTHYTYRVQHVSFMFFFFLKYIVLRMHKNIWQKKKKDLLIQTCQAFWTSILAIQGYRVLLQKLFFSQ